MQNNPVIVFVADEKRSQEFASNNNLVIFGADSARDALSQVIFSRPDVIVIDASEDILRAVDSFSHLNSINHAPIIMLSNMRQRWDTSGENDVTVMSEYSANYEIEETVRSMLTDKKVAC